MGDKLDGVSCRPVDNVVLCSLCGYVEDNVLSCRSVNKLDVVMSVWICCVLQ